jgi:methyltransferase (TIGR00027 family)
MNSSRWRIWPRLRARPSRTSQVVAAIRAELPRPHTADGDPGAQARLSAGMRPAGEMRLRAHLAARTQFFDEQVLAALGRGVRQVVILGAGYDDRGLRFRSPGVRYFELDHPATQADKRRRLTRMRADLSGLTLIAADFRYDDVGAVLDAAGHDGAQASLFLCEGLLVYLDQDGVIGLLSALRARSGDDSTLVASLAIHREGIDSARVVAAANARRPNGAAEPWRTIRSEADHLSLVTGAGWSVSESVADAASGGDATGTGATVRSMLVTARSGPAGPG